MARKQVARKTSAKKLARKAGSRAVSRKTAPKKKATRKRTTKVSSRHATTSRTAPRKSHRQQPAAQRLKPNERLEKMTIEIEKQKSGDLIVTEPIAGSIRVHHTVHPDNRTTAIPGKSYKALKRLREGTHQITVKRRLEPAGPGSQS